MQTINAIAARMTAKYVLTLVLLAILAVTNYMLLRAQIHSTRSVAAVVDLSGSQRALLQRSLVLAQELAMAEDWQARGTVRQKLLGTIWQLDRTHYELIRAEAPAFEQPPAEVKAVYNESPWLLDTEIRNYVAQARSLAEVPDAELHMDNPHLQYLLDAAESGRLTKGLDAVSSAYVKQGQAKADRLRSLSNWSLASTLAILAGAGVAVFRPMVQRVRRDMAALQHLNDTLDARVKDRAALAERRADELAASEAALRDSEALYRSLVDNLPMCVLRKDMRGRLLFVNEQFCEWQRARPEQLLGKTDKELYPPPMAAKYQRDDHTVLESGRVLQDVELHRAPGGKERFVEVLKAPLRDAQGHVIGTQTVFWDVTDRQRAEQRAQRAERLAAIGQMVSGVAHESRNALQQIEACSQMLEWEVEKNAEALELLADLRAAQSRLLRLFEDLRGYAAPMKLELRRTDLLQVIDAAWKDTAPDRNGKSATLDNRAPDDAKFCQVDPFKLEQVFRNLFENSLAACKEPARIETDLRAISLGGEQAVRIAVRDHGPGLNEEQRRRIFDAFYTTKSKGSGLGMAIVKRIVESHGGRIEVGNGSQTGAEFVITLPRGEI